jgi:ethanolamine utilization protein EutA (predicted chaperonin)
MHVELISRGRVIFSKESFQILLDEKFVELDDDTIHVNDAMKNTLDRLVAFLQENGALRAPTATTETVIRAEAQKT